jgi:hypothetical protein
LSSKEDCSFASASFEAADYDGSSNLQTNVVKGCHNASIRTLHT